MKIYDEDFLIPYSNSTKSHKLIALPNGIITLLVSDPAEDLASIALCIASGANNDPKDIPGLAHFCEHLILLGSKNYPDANEFHDMLSKAGGRRNAFTTDEQTCYFFEVPSDATHKLADQKTEEPVFNHLSRVFGDAFKNPLFPESMFEREIYAIDNEHNANKNNTGRLLYHGLRLVSNPEHPFHQFSTGNFFTLNDLPNMKKIKVKDQLTSYYENNYVAERMSLVIRSPQSLNQLQKMAVANFGDIKTSAQFQASKKSKFKIFGGSKTESLEPAFPKDSTEFNILSSWDYSKVPTFSSKEANGCIFIQSSNTPTLRLLFPVQTGRYGSKLKLLEDAWCNLVGDESDGSLDDLLKNKGYILGLSAFTQSISIRDEVLVLELKLTNAGAKKISEIITWTMKHYKSKLMESESELARYLCELESVDLLNYLFRDNYKSPMKEASVFATGLQKNIALLNSKNIVKGSTNWDCPYNIGTPQGDEFWTAKAVEFKEFVNQSFDLSNLRLCFLGDLTSVSAFVKESASCGDEKLSDVYFDFDYLIGKLQVSSFKHNLDYIFKLALHNEFIPEYAMDHVGLRNIILESSKESAKASLGYISKNSWIEEPAKNIVKSDRFEVWVKHEKAKVYKSKVFISFEIVSIDQEPSAINTMNAEIFVELLKQRLRKRLYSMELLNYSWEIQASLKGDVRFGFTISGYSEGIDILLDLLVSEFSGFSSVTKITSEELRKSRVAVRSRYSELTQNSSIEMALSGLLVVLEENIWTLEERLDALDDIDLDAFTEFIGGFRNSTKFLKLFVQGDFNNTDSYSVTINRISKHLESGPTIKNFKEPSTHAITPGKSFSIEKPGAKDDPMNAISYFIETGNKDDQQAKQLTRLLTYMMSSTLVPDLRYKKQLGYAVLGGTRILRSKIGIHITVMSGTFSPKYLEKKIKEYLANWEKSLDSLSESKFQSEIIEPYKKNFKKNLTESGGPENLISMMLPSIGSSNILENMSESMKSHKEIFDYISTNSYKDTEESEEIFQFLIKSEFMKFFKTKISNSSPSKADLSIFIVPQLTPEESQMQLMKLQLEAFLKMKGLRISSDTLKEIVERSKGNQITLMKDLFKYFLSQGESFKLCTIVLKEVMSQVANSMKTKAEYNTVTTASGEIITNDSEKIDDLSKFKSRNPVFYL